VHHFKFQQLDLVFCMKQSTFVRKGASRQTVPPGTKPSVHNGQLLVSSGLRDFDTIIGGGLPIGSVVCIQEDRHSQYAQNLLRYFISEGLSCGHSIATCLAPVHDLRTFLPLNHTERVKMGQASALEEDEEEVQKSELKIAWRYKEFVDQQVAAKKLQKQTVTPLAHQQQGTVSCHEYDLSKEIQQELFDKHADYTLELTNEDYKSTLQKISDRIITLRKAKDRSANIVLRIAFQSIGSLFYGDDKQLMPFLYALRSLMRSSLSVCVFTVPKECLSTSRLDAIRQASDIVIDLNSFVGGDIDVSDWEFKEYSGLLDIIKLPRMNSLTTNYSPESLNYAFKLKRRKMYIERLNLPPEETREASNPDRPKYHVKDEENERIMKDLYGSPEEVVMGCASGMVQQHRKNKRDTLEF
jgi:elongator complex protein 4